MKKLCLLILFLAPTIIKGQDIGAVAGITYSQVAFLNNEESEFNDNVSPVVGFRVGAKFCYPFSEFLELDFHMDIGQKGWIEKYSDLKRTTRLLYLNVPVLIRWSFPVSTESKTRVFGELGPALSYALRGKEELIVDGEAMEPELLGVGFDSHRDIFPIDMGVSMGAGVRFKRINVGVFYTFGMIDITPQINEGRIKNRSGGLRVSWIFEKRGG